MSVPPPPPLFAVVDRRTDGTQRIVAEYREPIAAHRHAIGLRWAGCPAEVELVTSVAGDDDAA